MADRKISDLTALTTPASGDFLPIVDISEAAAASKNKRITIEELMRGVPDGTAAAPGIAFETYPSTGIYSSGADQLAVSTGGTGRLFISSTGLVGIGTSAPNASLDVTNGGFQLTDTSSSFSASESISYYHNTSTQYAEIQFSPQNGGQGYIYFKNRVGNVLTNVLTIQGSNVGIGTTSPATTLDVNGNVTITDKIIHGGDTNTAIRFPAADTVSVETAGSERARIDSSGRLLIGTSTASVTATQILQGNSGAASGNGKLIFARGTTSPANGLGLGEIAFSDSSHSSSVTILAARDGGTWTSGTSQPTRLVFSTTADGASSPTERLRINSVGQTMVNSAGSASAPVLRKVGDTNTGIFFPATDTIAFAEGGAEAARIDSSGRLLVGTSTSVAAGSTTPSTLQVSNASGIGATLYSVANASGPGGVLVLGHGRATAAGLLSSGDVVGQVRFAGGDGGDLGTLAAQISVEVDGTPGANDMPGRIVLLTTADGASSSTERLRITSAGRVGIGTVTPATTLDVNGDITIAGRTEIATTGDIFSGEATNAIGNTTERFYFSAQSGVGNTICNSGSSVLTISRATADDGNVLRFGRGGTNVGTISVSAGATAYNTSSDYRLKENITLLDGAIARLNQLPVHRFNFIADPDKEVDGFLAHEAAAVVPECVTGEKDEVDEDGNAVYQGIDQSKLVPLLTAALQEAIGEIESLKARLTAAGI
jgi:hypothetical protein